MSTPAKSDNTANWIIWLVIGGVVIAALAFMESKKPNPSSDPGPELHHYNPVYPGSHMDED